MNFSFVKIDGLDFLNRRQFFGGCIVRRISRLSLVSEKRWSMRSESTGSQGTKRVKGSRRHLNNIYGPSDNRA